MTKPSKAEASRVVDWQRLADLECPICDLKDLARVAQTVWDSHRPKADGCFLTISFTEEEIGALTFVIQRVYAEANGLKNAFYQAIDGDEAS